MQLTTISLSIVIDRSTMSSINEYYSSMTGINPYYTYDFGFLKSQTSYKHIDKNSKAYISRSGMINIGGSIGQERTLDYIYDNDIYIGNALLRQFAPYSFPAYIDFSYNVNNSSYLNTDPMLRNKRLDIYTTLGTTIHYIHKSYLDFYLSYSTSRNNSNVNLYEFKRNQIVAGVSVFF
jgi:hypothetical protein